MGSDLKPVGLTLPRGESVPPTKLVRDEERSRSERYEFHVTERPRHRSPEEDPSFENDHDQGGMLGGVRRREGKESVGERWVVSCGKGRGEGDE